MESRRVVVTGIGALTPIGNNTTDYWQALLAGKSGADTISYFDPTPFRTRFACELKAFDPLNFLDRKEVRRMDTFTQYALITAEEALNDSDLLNSSLDRNRIGVIWGSGIGGLRTFHDQIMDYADRGVGNEHYKYNPFFIPKMIVDIASGQISIKHDLRGPNFATVSACASSTNSLIDAFLYIKNGISDAVVTGGSEAAITESGVGGFSSMRALSERNDDPQTASRPFDKERDGFVLGEGSGAVILEELNHALSRGAKIYAEVGGFGLSADAHHLTAPHPEGLGATQVMQNTLQNAGMTGADVDYINVHGTSTPLGDVAECKAIRKVFGEDAYKLNISSTKSMTGHLLGAAGAIEAIACIKAVEENQIPPTINHFTDDPNLDAGLNLTFNKKSEREVRVAISNTFGFGGHNASILFKKYVQ